jgi:transposase
MRFSEPETQKVKPKKYSVDFKKEAVRYMILEGERVTEVAKRLGVNANMLYRWKDKYLAEIGGDTKTENGSSPKEMAAELDRLRKELQRSQRMNEILKKTVIYFGKEDQ